MPVAMIGVNSTQRKVLRSTDQVLGLGEDVDVVVEADELGPARVLERGDDREDGGVEKSCHEQQHRG